MRKSKSAALALACGLAAAGTDSQAGTYRLLHAFQGGKDGAGPVGNLLEVGGLLYGTTNTGGGAPFCASQYPGGCGTVFTIDPSTGAEKIIHVLKGGTDGAFAGEALIANGDMLYGTSFSGGSANRCGGFGCGTLFAVNPVTHAERVVHAFTAASHGAGLATSLLEFGGRFYGTTSAGGSAACYGSCGVIFAFNPQTNNERIVHYFQGSNNGDGAGPYFGSLYGTTQHGGSNSCNCGTVYAFNPATGEERVLHAFLGPPDGAFPVGSLINVGGTLFGTTEGYNYGTVFSVNPRTGAEKVVYAFHGGKDGDTPAAGLVKVGDLLYSTTFFGGGATPCGQFGCGTIYSLNPKTGAEHVVYAFKGGADSAQPTDSMIEIGGTLYGVSTYGGGARFCSIGGGCGTVFSFKP